MKTVALFFLAVSCVGIIACKSPTPVAKVDEQPATQHVNKGPAYLGILYTFAQKGVQVLDVMPESPAERAGLLRGDVILKADGAVLAKPDSFRRHILARRPGNEIALVILRKGRAQFEIRPVLDVWDRRFPLEMQAVP